MTHTSQWVREPQPLTLSSCYITSLLSPSIFARIDLDIQSNIVCRRVAYSKTLRSFISLRYLSRRMQRCVLRSSSPRCALCHSELVNGYKREAFQWIHYVGQPIRRRRAIVAVETGPDGTDCVDELLISLSFTKTERNFRSGSAECKQTVNRHCTGRKEDCECIWWGVYIPHAQVTHLNSV